MTIAERCPVLPVRIDEHPTGIVIVCECDWTSGDPTPESVAVLRFHKHHAARRRTTEER